ncbi:MAG TPA: non-canonical purine NTP pyrophosphatase [Verrucomicrobiae bacterium]
MITLILATRNKHKTEEIQQILGPSFRCLSLVEFPDAPPIEENATTFGGNATLKSAGLAHWLLETPGKLSQISGEAYVLADDSGLEVDALNGAPGVYSARFANLDSGKPGNSPDGENNAKLLRLMQGVPTEIRSARFRCALALTPLVKEEKCSSPPCAADELETATLVFEGACEGRMDTKPAGGGGFGYDPMFIPVGYDKSFAELGEEVKNKLSHRSKALEKMLKYFAKQ